MSLSVSLCPMQLKIHLDQPLQASIISPRLQTPWLIPWGAQVPFSFCLWRQSTPASPLSLLLSHCSLTLDESPAGGQTLISDTWHTASWGLMGVLIWGLGCWCEGGGARGGRMLDGGGGGRSLLPGRRAPVSRHQLPFCSRSLAVTSPLSQSPPL